MIEEALRYPVLADEGRDRYLALTGLLLATAIALRVARTLFPNALVFVPLVIVAFTAVLAIGICVSAFLTPADRLPGVRSLTRLGTLAGTVAGLTLLVPFAFLFWTAVTYVDGGAAVDSGGAIFFLLGSTIALFGFLAATYVLPAVVAQAVESSRLRAATDRRAIVGSISEIPYLQGWSVAFALWMIGWWASIASLEAGSVNGLLATAVAGYCLLASVRAMGIGYAGGSTADLGEASPGR
ncbi:hypothetical protein [Salinarchaeum laminariae]|uniref:hypothetical protein n=1 Tax=Salinarchaeum laminariae TaxID=869888 RepID=UPI0020BF2BE8|nr:hypothetical protein [Salinarchaeum laminariae]